jgi:pimeloyl-ACP methyl ester carboxylesterase
MTRLRRGLLAGTVAGSLALGGCGLFDGVGAEPAPTVAPTNRTPPAGEDALQPFYEQQLDWTKCEGGYCATLRVPLDYDNPTGQTISVSLLKVPARRKATLGSLVVNPGGPGASGIDYARSADNIVGASVRARYDVVGFDPRGVQRSDPIKCLDDGELDNVFAADPTPDGPAEEQHLAEEGKALADGCRERSGALVAHVSSLEVVRDMDVLRAALGEDQLNYLGKSYGTYLGALYAGMFPKRVGRFVLDGVLPPDLGTEEVLLGQAEGFERATRAWAASCVQEGNCALGDSTDAVMSGLRDLLRRIDEVGVPVGSDARVRSLTEGWASYGVAYAMYDQGLWGYLDDALQQVVVQNRGDKLMDLADGYADRSSHGSYLTNSMEAFFAVSCLDSPDTNDVSVLRARAEAFAEKAPTWGRFLGWGSMACGYWPVQSGNKPAPVTAEGSGPIVVVGTTRDPATPYEWSVHLRKELSNAVLITYNGDGHTAYQRSNACVDKPIDAYYVSGSVPKDGLRC